MATKKRTKPQPPREGFIRTTVTIPSALQPFIEGRQRDPLFAGSLSSYLRTLIIQDKASAERKLKAA